MKRCLCITFCLLICLQACRRDQSEYTLLPGEVPARITRLEIQVATPFVNVDSASQLLINYRAYRPKEQFWYDHPADKIELYVNGLLHQSNTIFMPNQPGIFTLQARSGHLISEPISVTARNVKSYEPVRLPVVFHFPTNANPAATSLPTLLREVNALFRNRVPTTDPNQADSFIEFYPAEKDPSGRALIQPGLNRLPFSDQPTDSASAIKADSILRQWCVKSYINVFVKLNWLRNAYPVGYSYASTPGLYTNRTATTIFECGSYRGHHSGPAVMIAYENNSGILAHELGHFLGLQHTFLLGCALKPVNYTIVDTPLHTEEHPSEGRKRAYRGAPFVATNVMDYYIKRANFTQDQIRIMRSTIDDPTYLPLPTKTRSGRLSVGQPLIEVGCRIAPR